MKTAVTAEEIAKWFTLGSKFTNIRITDEAVKEPEATIRSCPSAQFEQGSPETGSQDVRRRTKTTELQGCAPRLASYEFPRLPITKHRHELISVIEHNSVVIICGATGSGKTTQLPQFILDHYSQKDAPCNIVVTQPRKIGALSIARWVARERKCVLSNLVGYQVGLEKMATEHTRLIYVTTGVLLQKVVAAKTLTEYSHIFIDEVHERTEDMDLLLLVIKKLLQSNSRYVKVVLMSATMNCTEFAEYFAMPVHGRMNPAYVFKVDGAPHAIEQSYLDDLRFLRPRRAVWLSSDEPHISEEMYSVAVNLIQSFDEMETKDHSQTKQDVSLNLPERGSVLVFLPGLQEIRHMQEALPMLMRRRLLVYRLHSTVTLEEQKRVFLPVPGYRKIILSTNISESSITVPDIKYVIDFCLARHLVCDKETNYQSLRLTWASKSNCNQRKGRAGRVSKGYCYRLVNKKFWETHIPEHMIPEMLVAPLASVMLKVKLLDMGNPRVLLSKALSPPNLDNIVRTVRQLKMMGALSAKSDNDDDGELTFLGRVLAHLPVDPHLGKMIALGHVFGCLRECLIMVACLSLKSFFTVPSLEQMVFYRKKLSFANGIPSDAIAFLNAFEAWHSAKKTGELRIPKDELDWGKANFIEIKRIREVAELYEDLKNRVSQFNMKVSESPLSMDYTSVHKQLFIIQVVIAGAYYPNYFVQGELDEEMAAKDLCGHDPRTTVMMRNLPPYSFLYHEQLQALFRQCGQVKAISFDHSRAYVEFSRATARSAGVLTEVRLALLLDNKKLPLCLFTHPSHEVRSCTASGAVSEYGRVNVDFQNKTVLPARLQSNMDVENLPSTRRFTVNITKVTEVGQFWGCRADEASVQKQMRLTTEINGRPLLPVQASLYPDLLCLAPFSEGGRYCRAKVQHVCSSTVEVLFVDSGDTASVPCSSLRQLPADLASEPFQAQEFFVVGMRPSAQSLILGGRWSQRAWERYVSLTQGYRALVSLYSIVHGVMRVALVVMTADSVVDVVDVMVKEGHAVPAREGYDSKQNHENLPSLYKVLADQTDVPNSMSSSWQQRVAKDTELIGTLLTCFKDRKCKLPTKVRLTGPTSPHKVRFHSFSHSAHYKPVYINRFSINRVVVNDDLQHNHQRMLVAGSVVVNSTSSNIELQDTTLMPDMPGLPALMAMLFTPVMELRSNLERTRYTGVTCGLGTAARNSSTQPVLSEGGMELPLDTHFDEEDITDINVLRDALNRLLSEGPWGLLHLGPHHIARVQEDCRDRLIRLCGKSPARDQIPGVSPARDQIPGVSPARDQIPVVSPARDQIPVVSPARDQIPVVSPARDQIPGVSPGRDQIPGVYYQRPGLWNQVDPKMKMNVQPEEGRSKSVPFLLHPIVLLED